MSRAVLLVICDFLLLSLLALARFDLPKEEEPPEVQVDEAAEKAVDQDLIEVLKLSLETEEEQRKALSSELEEQERLARELAKRKAELEAAKSELEEEKSTLLTTKSELEEEKSELLSVKEQLETEKEDLSSRFSDTQQQLVTTEQERATLLEDLMSVRETAAAEKERVRMLQEQMQDRDSKLAEAEESMKTLEEQREAVRREKEQLATQLQIRETEKQMLEQNLVAAQAEIETVRLEKESIQKQTDQLVEGVSVLAESSTAITEEIRSSQPISLNRIFSDFKENRATAQFTAELGNGRTRDFVLKTIFVSDGRNTYALFHTRDTPFRLNTSNLRYDSVRAAIAAGNTQTQLGEVHFLAADPRILVAPVSESFVEQTGKKVFLLALEPLKFPEAVLIDGDEGYYGESSFKLDPEHEGYFTVESRIFNRLFGEFSPSRSDLVFAKTGDFMGLMINRDYCRLVDSFYPAASLTLGEGYNGGEAEAAFTNAKRLHDQLPSDFQ